MWSRMLKAAVTPTIQKTVTIMLKGPWADSGRYELKGQEAIRIPLSARISAANGITPINLI